MAPTTSAYRMTLIELEAQRRASEFQVRIADAKKAKALKRDGYLEHAIVAQMFADAIRWGITHESERRSTDAAALDDSLEDGVPGSVDGVPIL